MRVYHRPIERYTHATGWDYIDPDAAPSVITRPAGGGATIETLTATRYATGLWFIATTDALYTGGSDYEMVWTVTIDGDTGDAPPEMFRHVTPTAETTPDPPTIGTPTVTATTAVFPQTPTPGATTTISILSDTGVLTTASGAGATISFADLIPGHDYSYCARAVSATGGISAVGDTCLGTFKTPWALPVANRIQVRWEANDSGLWSANCPEYVDPAVTGCQRVGGLTLEAARILRFRFQCNEPVDADEVRNVTMFIQGRFPRPGGIMSATGG